MKLYKKSQLKSKIQPNKKIFVNFLVEFMKMSQPKSKLGGEKVFFWVTFKNSKKSQEKSKTKSSKSFCSPDSKEIVHQSQKLSRAKVFLVGFIN